MHPLSIYHTGPNYYDAGLIFTIQYSGKEVERRVKVSLCVALVINNSGFDLVKCWFGLGLNISAWRDLRVFIANDWHSFNLLCSRVSMPNIARAAL